MPADDATNDTAQWPAQQRAFVATYGAALSSAVSTAIVPTFESTEHTAKCAAFK